MNKSEHVLGKQLAAASSRAGEELNHLANQATRCYINLNEKILRPFNLIFYAIKWEWRNCMNGMIK